MTANFAAVLTVAFLYVSAGASAQADQLDDYLKAEIEKQRITGLSVAVLRDGKLVTAREYGLASVEFSVPVTQGTVYQLASATKLFTGAAVMMLVEQGRLSLDDSLVQRLPELPAAWRNVTVRHLLSPTSGLPDWFEGNLGPHGNPLDFLASRDDIIRKISARPVEFQPGEKWSYNWSGPVLLGMIVERVTGSTFEQFLDDRIFKPLRMTATRFGSTGDVIANLNPMWYAWEGGVLGRFDLSYPKWGYPGAELNSTIPDLAKWDAALYTDRILKESTREMMWTRITAQ